MRPMLAGKADVTKLRYLRYPLIASPKLDGVRALVVDSRVMSRSMKPIPNSYVQTQIGRANLNGLDGELIVGPPTAPDAFRRTVSGVMSVDGAPPFVFHVFDDYIAATQPFLERIKRVNRATHGASFVVVVPHTTIKTPEELEIYEARTLANGYEGVMLRDPSGPYKYGRSTAKEGWLLKLKRFIDSEAEVIGVEELCMNTNDATRDELGRTKRSSAKVGQVPTGTLGALQVRDVETGVVFYIGTGFDAATRDVLWSMRKTTLIGSLVKYKHQLVGAKDKPRLPVFLGFRNRIDL